MGVWIDTDMGFDDIAAVLVVMQSGLEIDGVSLVFGNAPLKQACQNAAGAVAAFGWDFPIHSGRELPVLGQLETAERILGETGIPTLGRTLPDVGPLTIPRGMAFTALCDWLENGEGEKRILALGPLTNIAALCLARPDLAERITDLTWMGGGVTAGNHTASAEFNAFADPEALSIVISSRLPFHMVDLDLCRKVTASPEDVDPVRNAGGRNAEMIADFLGGFIRIATSRGRSSMALYDPVAAVAFCYPELVTWQKARIDVELQGTFTRGRTVLEARPGRAVFNARYGAEVNAERARDIILKTLVVEGAR